MNPANKITAFIESIFGASWRTAITGYAMSLFLIIEPIISNGDFEIHRDWKKCVFAIMAAIYAKNSKDKQVTGTDKENDQARP